ncbi:MAG: DUF1207 domain-containing protein [Desulfobacterales bacterium]|nr:DUF1207 domain-containing protein [Desulfobacterales bacterium]
MNKTRYIKHLILGIAILGLSLGMTASPGPALAEQSPRSQWEIFPSGDVFSPLVADPKEPRFFLSINNYDNEFRSDFTGASVGFGENFGLIRKHLGDQHAWQLSLKGGLFSQFDLNSDSDDLLNSDYNIGVTWNYRIDALSTRLRVYHQSSHLGDEYLLKHPRLADTRTNFDNEAIDFLAAFTWQQIRTYGGLHFLIERDPGNLDRWGYQGGIEYQGTGELLPWGALVAGLDIKGFQELHWTPGYSVKTGIAFKELDHQSRYIQVMLEYYNGFIPYGQFYDYDMESYGAGIYFGF